MSVLSFLGGLLGVGASAYGASQSYKAQVAANEANLLMNKRTNTANAAAIAATNRANRFNVAATNRANALQSAKERRLSYRMFKEGYHSPGENLASTVAMARKLGINPLAALGGASASTMPYTVPGSIPAVASQDQAFQATPGQVAPATAAGDMWSVVGAQLANLAAQTENVQEQTASIRRNDAMKAFDVAASGARSRSFASGIRRASTTGSGSGPVPTDVRPRVLVLPNGEKFVTGASTSTQDVENEYGDIVQNAYGLWRFAQDLGSDSVRLFRTKTLPDLKWAWAQAGKAGKLPPNYQEVMRKRYSRFRR